MAGKRAVHVFATVLSSSPENVFPLLCPTREYDWLPHWQCELIYSQSGYAEPGCVFRTDLKDYGGQEVWVVCTYEQNKRIGFVRTGPHHTIRYTITLVPHENGSTIQWEQEMTSLDKAGEGILDNLTENVYQEKMEHINRLLEHYLINQKPLNEK